jgi:hypothetical protein
MVILPRQARANVGKTQQQSGVCSQEVGSLMDTFMPGTWTIANLTMPGEQGTPLNQTGASFAVQFGVRRRQQGEARGGAAAFDESVVGEHTAFPEDGVTIIAEKHTNGTSMQVRKRHFLSHLYIKCIILPRQARDKHRESTQKSAVFSQRQVAHFRFGRNGTHPLNPKQKTKKTNSTKYKQRKNAREREREENLQSVFGAACSSARFWSLSFRF